MTMLTTTMITKTMLTTRRAALFVSIFLSMPLSLAVAAQAPSASKPSAYVTTQAPSHGASGTAYKDYAAYPCLASAYRMVPKDEGVRRLTWRDRWPDTATAADAPDSLIMAASKRRRIGELKQCLAPYTISNIPARHRLGLGLAWLGAEDDAKAEAAFRAVIEDHAQAPIEERALVLSQIAEAYLDGTPKHLAIALGYTAQLDALGTPVAGRRLAMHNSLYAMAQGLDTLPLMIEQAQLARKINDELTGDTQGEWMGAIERSRLNLADLEARRGNFALAVKILEDAGKELKSGAFAGELWGRYKHYGTPAKPLVATFVGQPGHSELLATLPPTKPGRVSLRVHVFERGYFEPLVPIAATVQRIVRQYGSKIDVTLVTATVGSDRYRLIANPEDESKRIVELFHDYLKIPAPIVIHGHLVTGKLVDGRLVYRPDPNYMGAVTMVLVDGKGNIRNIDNGGEVRLRHLIEELTTRAP